MSAFLTHSTEGIAEELMDRGVQVTPQDLKKVTSDLLIQVYLCLLNELGYTDEIYSEVGNFEAIQDLEKKEEFEEFFPIAHFGRILNKVMTELKLVSLEVSHYDLFFPKWKKHRNVVSVLIHYCNHVRDMKKLYDDVCLENVKMCENRKIIDDLCIEVKEKMTSNLHFISTKKNVEKLDEVSQELAAETRALIKKKDKIKEVWSQLKEDTEKEEKHQIAIVNELAEIKKETEQNLQMVIQHPEERYQELEELRKKIETAKLEYYHKEAENEAWDNRFVVDPVNKALSATESLQSVDKHFHSFEMELDIMQKKQDTKQLIVAKRQSLENAIKTKGKEQVSLKEQIVDSKNSLEKQNMQLKEALKDRMTILLELENNVSNKVTMHEKMVGVKTKELELKGVEQKKTLELLDKKVEHLLKQQAKLKKNINDLECKKNEDFAELKDRIVKEKQLFYKAVDVCQSYLDKLM